MKYRNSTIILLAVIFFTASLAVPNMASSDSYRKISRESQEALQKLYKKSPKARELAKSAKAILVFPGIIKGGFIVGGQYGEGALFKGEKPVAYYNTVSVSYGLQAGGQSYGYAMFLMTDDAVAYLDKSDGWELGTGPSIVVMDKGAAGSLSTTTAKSDVYAFFFDQKGLMAGLGLQGTKISRK